MIKVIKKSKNFRLFLIACLVISTIFTFNITSSRYVGKISSDDDIIAKPILTLSNNNQSFTIENMLPGDEREYDFVVSNFDGNQTNEVLLDYYFRIENQTEIPLKFELFEIIDETENILEITDGLTKSSEMKVVKNEEDKILKTYKLKIIWDAKYNSSEYANKIIDFNVVLEGIQTN